MVDEREKCGRCGQLIPVSKGVILLSTAKQGYLQPMHRRCAIRQREDDARWVRRELDRNPKYRAFFYEAIERYLDMTDRGD